MDLTQLSCEDFLSQLASKAPAPGGGGAAALVGAAGVALGNMVGNLTTGKKKYYFLHFFCQYSYLFTREYKTTEVLLCQSNHFQ